jgi:hypothetical protein
MKKLIFLTVFTLLSCELLLAQKSEPGTQMPTDITRYSAADLATKVPAPRPDDVKSMDGIMRAIYESISGPAGGRDWDRFRSLFLPQARFTDVTTRPEGTMVMTWSVDEFIHIAGEVFAKDPFYEKAIVNRPESFGNVTQVFSSYESRRSPTDKPFERGINSVQLLNDGQRWWVLSILWDRERPGNPLPRKFSHK